MNTLDNFRARERLRYFMNYLGVLKSRDDSLHSCSMLTIFSVRL